MSTPTPLDFAESDIPPGLSVIEASAGTGKTYAISHLVPRLLLDGTVRNLSEILLVTFTNDAARELSERVRRVLEALATSSNVEKENSNEGICKLRERFSGEEHHKIIQQALIDIDRINISTIHLFCQRTIQTEGTLCGLPVVPEVITNADDFIGEALHDLWQDKIAPDPFLAMLASNGSWDISQDFYFVRMAFAMEDFEPVPETQPFEETLERIKNSPREFTQEILKELAGFFTSVGTWNNSAGDEPSRAAWLQYIAGAKTFTDPNFWTAMEWISNLEGHISGRGNAGKASKAKVKELRAVNLTREIMSVLGRLRWNWQNECVRSVRKTVQSALHANREITQDGLILTLRDALRSPKKEALADRLRERYKVALIDESQDTDPKQFEIFKNIFIGFESEPPLKNHRLVMIGDPKQAIYGFRGADVNTYLEAKNRAQKIFTLVTTFRSPQPLVEAVNAFFGRADSLLKKDLDFYSATSGVKEDTQLFKDGKPYDGRIEAWIVPDGCGDDYKNSADRSRLIIDTVASEVVRLLKCGKMGTKSENAQNIQPKDFAVLTNSNAEAEMISAALKERGVPAIVASGADVMGTDEAKELLSILRAVNEPRRSGLRYAALATRLIGHDSVVIQGIRSDPVKDDEALQKFLQWQAAWERKGIAAAIALMDMGEGITRRIAASDQGERRVTNFRQLIDLLQSASQEYSNRPGHLLRWLSQEIARAEDRGAAEDRQTQLESDSMAVQVVTMHKAKGLEYNLVFAPFLWSLQDPKGIRVLAKTKDYLKDRLVNVDLRDGPEIYAALKQSELEDRLRLAYVAMTRAKVRLWIYGGEMGSSRRPLPASPLCWLLRDVSTEVKSSEQFGAWAENATSSGRGSRHSAGIKSLVLSTKPGLILEIAPPLATSERWTPSSPADEGALSALQAPEMGNIWSITSFSSLTREKNPHASKDPVRVAEKPQEEIVSSRSKGAAFNPFNSAPGGTFMGTAIHDWMERWNCDEPDAKSVKEHLKKFNLTSIQNNSDLPLDESVLLMLKELRKSTLPGLNCAICEACPSHEASEWHFHLPIKDTLNPHLLAEVFAEHATPDHQAYAPMLELLPAQDLQGFLQGFMDRLVFHQDAWGVIDWKTNKLGDHPDSYGPESLLTCAMQSHYLLQANLYLVALRRYLRLMTPGAKLAGAWLVFLRGVRADTSEGILHCAPGDRLLNALDDLFFEGK